MVLLLRGLAAGDQAGNRVVPLPDDEGRLGVGHQRVGEPPPRAELVVERLPVRRSRLVDEVTVEQRQAEEELRLQRQRPRCRASRQPARRLAGRGPAPRRSGPAARPPPAKPSGPTPSSPHRPPARRWPAPGRRRFTPTMVARSRSAPSSAGPASAPDRRVEAGASRSRLACATATSSAARFWSASADKRKAQRGVHLGGVLPGEHRFGAGRRLGHLPGAQQRATTSADTRSASG